MLTFYLVRHGNTEGNHKRFIMGYQIDAPLTDEGLKSANTLSQKLKNIKFDRVYSSDLGRAFITAHIIAENLKIGLKLSRAKELREINYGVYTHRKKEEVEKECPQYKTDVNFIFPDGESFSQMQKRVCGFIEKLEKKHPDKTLLLVAHAGVIRAIKCYFNGWNFQEHLKMKITHNYIGKFVIDKGKIVSCEYYN